MSTGILSMSTGIPITVNWYTFYVNWYTFGRLSRSLRISLDIQVHILARRGSLRESTPDYPREGEQNLLSITLKQQQI